MPALRIAAPAKLNLFLHVTGKRADGYHLLDSLVAFSEFGDTLEITPADALTLEIMGPFADGLSGEDNLVMKAARLLAAQAQGQGAHMVLHKNIPVGAGLGGGSSDAAAALKGLAELWEVPGGGGLGLSIGRPPSTLRSFGATGGAALTLPRCAGEGTAEEMVRRGYEALGSDVPVCLAAAPAVMRGVGEIVIPVAMRALCWLLLVNPNRPLLTADVFRQFRGAFSPPVALPPEIASLDALIEYIAPCHNALEAPAMALMPVIGEILERLRGTAGCRCARMAGSGATCFGIYASEAAARQAGEALDARWWSMVTRLRHG